MFDVCRQIASDGSHYDQYTFKNEDCYNKAQKTYGMLIQTDEPIDRNVKCVKLTTQKVNFNDENHLNDLHSYKNFLQ